MAANALHERLAAAGERDTAHRQLLVSLYDHPDGPEEPVEAEVVVGYCPDRRWAGWYDDEDDG
jgi:hypothetical protein